MDKLTMRLTGQIEAGDGGIELINEQLDGAWCFAVIGTTTPVDDKSEQVDCYGLMKGEFGDSELIDILRTLINAMGADRVVHCAFKALREESEEKEEAGTC